MPCKLLSDPNLGLLDCPENVKVADSDDEVGNAYADNEQNCSFCPFFRTAGTCGINPITLKVGSKLKHLLQGVRQNILCFN